MLQVNYAPTIEMELSQLCTHDVRGRGNKGRKLCGIGGGLKERHMAASAQVSWVS